MRRIFSLSNTFIMSLLMSCGGWVTAPCMYDIKQIILSCLFRFFCLSVFRLGPPTLLLHSPSHLPFNKRVGYLKSIPVSARSCIQFSAEEVRDFRTSWQRASTKAVYSSLFFRRSRFIRERPRVVCRRNAVVNKLIF